VSVVQALAGGGRPGRELAIRIDLLRSIGPGEAWRRKRDDARLAQRASDGRRPGYTRIWADAAQAIGAQMADLGAGFLEFRRGDARARAWNNWVGLDDLVTWRLSLDKALVHRLLAEVQLPVPEHLGFDARETTAARAFLERAGGPCVVKPLGAAGGSGATSSVRTPPQLARAILRARRHGRRLLIERQVPGDVYRLLFLDGELLDVIRRRPPRVRGDGRSSIAALIAAENDRRFADADGERPWLLRADLDAVLTLEGRGLRLSSVPQAGEWVAVKTAVSQNGPHDNETVLHEVGPQIVEQARLAAAALGIRLAGVDVITTDPKTSLSQSAGVVLEVNATPGLHYHYEVSDRRRAVPVAVPILRRLLEEGGS
jgi:cyanophycin synthetase